MSRRPILLTGFDRFGDLLVNPSRLVIEQLPSALPGDVASIVETAVLETAYRSAATGIRALLERLRPAAVLSLGVAEGADGFRLERRARNEDDSQIPDEQGDQPRGEPIAAGGPAAYGSTLPLDELHAALAANDVPVAMSDDAGTFVCNHLFYVMRHEIETRELDTIAGFVHLPLATDVGPERDPHRPGLPLGVMVDAVRVCQIGRAHV